MGKIILTKVERTGTLSDIGFLCKDDVLGEMTAKVNDLYSEVPIKHVLNLLTAIPSPTDKYRSLKIILQNKAAILKQWSRAHWRYAKSFKWYAN